MTASRTKILANLTPRRFLITLGLAISSVVVGSAAFAQARLYVVRTPAGLTHAEFRFAGQAPAGFEDIDTIFLSRIQTAANGGVIARRPEGSMILKGKGTENWLELKNIVFKGEIVRFTTESRNGISYRFDGSMVPRFRLDKYGNIKGQVLHGTLVKLDRGVEVARTAASFQLGEYS